MIVLLLVRFLAELGLLAALGWAGWVLPDRTLLSVLLAVALPLLAAAVWGFWVAPRAGRRLADPLRLGVEVVLFGAAGVLLLAGGAPVAALALVAAYLVSVPSRGHEPAR